MEGIERTYELISKKNLMKWEPLFINGRDSGTCPGLFRARM
jgi:hypothetical protein